MPSPVDAPVEALGKGHSLRARGQPRPCPRNGRIPTTSLARSSLSSICLLSMPERRRLCQQCPFSSSQSLAALPLSQSCLPSRSLLGSGKFPHSPPSIQQTHRRRLFQHRCHRLRGGREAAVERGGGTRSRGHHQSQGGQPPLAGSASEGVCRSVLHWLTLSLDHELGPPNATRFRLHRRKIAHHRDSRP